MDLATIPNVSLVENSGCNIHSYIMKMWTLTTSSDFSWTQEMCSWCRKSCLDEHIGSMVLWPDHSLKAFADRHGRGRICPCIPTSHIVWTWYFISVWLVIKAKKWTIFGHSHITGAKIISPCCAHSLFWAQKQGEAKNWSSRSAVLAQSFSRMDAPYRLSLQKKLVLQFSKKKIHLVQDGNIHWLDSWSRLQHPI
jgi:hypothetical protein